MRLIDGIVLGAAYVLPPGPILFEMLRRSAAGGVRTGLAVQLGAVGGRMLLALAMLSGSHLVDAPGVQRGLGLVGAAVLLWLGASAIWRHGQPAVEAMSAGRHGGGEPHAGLASAASAGVVLAVANPYGVALAVTLGSSSGSAATALVGFFIGSLVASMGLALVVGRVSGGWSTQTVRWLVVGAGGVLIGCGVRMLRSALGY